MRLIVNGEAREFGGEGAGESTLGAFLRSRDLHARMVVVERNGEIVARDRYDATPLADGDVLEIVQMMAGG